MNLKQHNYSVADYSNEQISASENKFLKKSNEILNLFPTLSTAIKHIIVDNDRFLNIIELILIRSIIGSSFDYV